MNNGIGTIIDYHTEELVREYTGLNNDNEIKTSETAYGNDHRLRRMGMGKDGKEMNIRDQGAANRKVSYFKTKSSGGSSHQIKPNFVSILLYI